MDKQRFSQLIQQYVQASADGYGKIAERAKLPKSTLYNWVRIANRPQLWQQIALFAQALGLSRQQLDELLAASDHPSISQLQKTDLPQPDRRLLAPWLGPQRELQMPRMETEHFTGRAEDLAQIKRALQYESSCCALLGIGGVGKSQLAYQAARTIAQHTEQGVIWAEVSGDDSLMGVLHMLASRHGVDVSRYPDLESRSQVVRQLLSTQDVLLVLDNIESKLQLTSLMPLAGRCRVLVTLRNSSLLQGMVCETISVESLRQSQSIQLLESLIGAKIPHEMRLIAERLIQFVDGLPLALDIMGRFLREAGWQDTLAEYADWLEGEQERLRNLEETTTESRSLLATFEASYRRLSAETQTVFSQLSIFGNSEFSEAAIAAVTNLPPIKVKLALRNLVNHGLVMQRTADIVQGLQQPLLRRCKLHALIQLFAREKVRDEATLASRFAQYFCQFAADFGADNYTAIDLEWLNIERALTWVAAEDDYKLLTQGVNGISVLAPGSVGYADARGYWREATGLLERLLPATTEPFAAAQLNCKLGAFNLFLSDWDNAAQHLQASHALYDTLPSGDEIILHRAYLAEFIVRYQLNHDNEAALSDLEEALSQLSTINSPLARHQQGNLSILKGRVLGQMLGMFDKATQSIEYGISLLPAEVTAARLSAYINLGTIAFHTGQLQLAQQHYAAGQAAAEALGDLRRFAMLTLNLGSVTQRMGHLTEAERFFLQAIDICERSGNFSAECGALNNLGVIYRIWGQDDTAIATLKRASTLAERHRLPVEEAYAQTTVALVLMRQQRWDSAENAITRAYHLAQSKQLNDVLPDVLCARALFKLNRRRDDGGLSDAQQALELAQTNQQAQQIGIASSITGRIQASNGMPDLAHIAHTAALSQLADQDIYELALAQVAFAKLLLSDKPAEAQALLLLAQNHFIQLGAQSNLAEIAPLVSLSRD